MAPGPCNHAAHHLQHHHHVESLPLLHVPHTCINPMNPNGIAGSGNARCTPAWGRNTCNGKSLQNLAARMRAPRCHRDPNFRRIAVTFELEFSISPVRVMFLTEKRFHRVMFFIVGITLIGGTCVHFQWLCEMSEIRVILSSLIITPKLSQLFSLRTRLGVWICIFLIFFCHFGRVSWCDLCHTCVVWQCGSVILSSYTWCSACVTWSTAA